MYVKTANNFRFGGNLIFPVFTEKNIIQSQLLRLSDDPSYDRNQPVSLMCDNDEAVATTGGGGQKVELYRESKKCIRNRKKKGPCNSMIKQDLYQQLFSDWNILRGKNYTDGFMKEK